MARSLSQMLLAGGQPAAGGGALTGVQQGLRTGIQLATLAQGLETQKSQAELQKARLLDTKMTLTNKVFQSMVTATSDSAARRKGKLGQVALRKLGIELGDDFVEDGVESRGELGKMSKQLGLIISDPNIQQEAKNKIWGEAVELFGQTNGFSKAFAATLQLEKSRKAGAQDIRVGTVSRQLNLRFGKELGKVSEGQRNLRQAARLVAEVRSDVAQGKAIGPKLNALSRSLALAFNKGPLSKEDVNSFLGQFGFAGGVSDLIAFAASKPPSQVLDQLEQITTLTADEIDKSVTSIRDQLRLSVETPEFDEVQRAQILQASGLSRIFPTTLEGITEKVAPEIFPGKVPGEPPGPAKDPVLDFINRKVKAGNITQEKAEALRESIKQEQQKLTEQEQQKMPVQELQQITPADIGR